MAPLGSGRYGPGGTARTVVFALIVSTVSPWNVADAADASAKKRQKTQRDWVLKHHSFEKTMSYDNTLDQWKLSASSMALRDRIQLTPPVINRHGMFFSKSGIETHEFSVEFTLSAFDNGENRGTAQDGHVAFWLNLESYTASFDEKAIVSDPGKNWQDGLNKQGLTFLSNRPQFKGLVVAFSIKNGKETITALWNDGSKIADLQNLPLTDALQKEFKWMSAGTKVKITHTKQHGLVGKMSTLNTEAVLGGSVWGFSTDGANNDALVTFNGGGKVAVDEKETSGKWAVLPANKFSADIKGVEYIFRLEGSHMAVAEHPEKFPRPVLLYGGKDTGPIETDWKDFFTFPARTLNAGAGFYMGFTAYTGSASYIEADLHRLVTVNLDPNVMGEEETDVLSEEASWLKMLESEKRFLDQANQTEALREITLLLNEHVERYEKSGDLIKKDLILMEERLDNLGGQMSTYLAAAKAYSFESMKFEPDAVKASLANLKTVLSSGGKKHDERMTEMSEYAQQLKTNGGGAHLSPENKAKIQRVKLQSDTVEKFAAEGSKQTSYLLFFLIAAVAGLAYLFFTKMNYYEKKHYI